MSNKAIPKLKIGDAVFLRLDPDARLLVTERNGKTCLKTPSILGWIYFEPEDWNDVILIS